MLNYDSLAARDKVNKYFDKIEDVLDCHGPIRKFPGSLLKARIDALSLLLLIDLEMLEADQSNEVPPEPFHATQ